MFKTQKPFALALAVALVVTAYGLTRGPSTPKIAALGNPAPDFALSDLGGKRVTLKGLRGKPVLLNFWATWCDSCAEELPDLKVLQKKLSPLGLTILAPSVDVEGKKVVLPFVARFELNFPVLYCDDKTSRAYGVRGLPTSWLVDADGTLVKRYVGPLAFAGVENDILRLIRRPS